ncbi:hypothetical protein DPEC_G00046840 [Dallia pectoralis]|uniref:Uncharacterized protein n=1 Tax=Dallia pectoralis TaxID=75939 RepID=A0ACC2HAV1_DALPE|nr:hypothetical protein DPEC_G00046840 [Dallia pectoralis]
MTPVPCGSLMCLCRGSTPGSSDALRRNNGRAQSSARLCEASLELTVILFFFSKLTRARNGGVTLQTEGRGQRAADALLQAEHCKLEIQRRSSVKNKSPLHGKHAGVVEGIVHNETKRSIRIHLKFNGS